MLGGGCLKEELQKRIFSWIGNRCLNLVIKERPKDIWVISVAWRGE